MCIVSYGKIKTDTYWHGVDRIPPSAPPLSDNLILIMFMGDQLDLQYGIVTLVISTPVLVFYIVRWWPKIRVNDVPV